MRIIAALPLALSAFGDHRRLAAFGRPVLRDRRHTGDGPLAGVLAELEWTFSIGATALQTVLGDTPFVPRDLAASLSPPPACAVCHGRMHHLIALWRDLLPWPDPRNVGTFVEMIGMRRVDFPLATWDAFLNVNTPADLEVARTQTGHLQAEGRALG